MPAQLARSLVRLEPRISVDTHTDSWALAWMLAVGATYSLARAQELLPGEPVSFRAHAMAILDALSRGCAPDQAASNTWTLGFYLNSTEARVQAAIHRVLRAYTGSEGRAPVLIQQIERLKTPERPPDRAFQILSPLRAHLVDRKEPSTAISRVWVRTNSVKHDPAQDVSDQFAFEARWADSRESIAALIELIEILGSHRGAISAAA